MFEFISTLGTFLYDWVLDANEEDYSIIINNDVLSYMTIFLVGISLFSVCFFYYGVAQKAANATKKNCIIVCLLGLLVLWLCNYILIPTIVEEWSYAFNLNNLLLSLIDTLYYIVLYELFSLAIKDGSNAKYIHLFNCFS